MANGSDDNNAYITQYKITIDLWKLASEQIYSRFSAMLTSSTIMVPATILTISYHLKIIPFIFILAGILICILWVFFNMYGIATEKRYIKKANDLEEKILNKVDDKQYRIILSGYGGFEIISYLTIIVFLIIYVFILCLYCSTNIWSGLVYITNRCSCVFL